MSENIGGDVISQPMMRIMQITSSLSPGGAERVALNLANVMATRGHGSHLCLTRGEGDLIGDVDAKVKVVRLERRNRYDLGALMRLVRYVKMHRVAVLHCHSTSLFMGAIVSRLCRDTRLLWHDHYGAYATVERPRWLYRLFTGRVAGVVAVNSALAAWAKERLRVPSDRVWYVPNFVVDDDCSTRVDDLPGKPGYRIVCVANLRPQKDHLNLLRAMKRVVIEFPQAHLLLAGSVGDPAYAGEVQQAIQQDALRDQVTWLGSRKDVRSILRSCDVGVLSSASEGLPLALLEYGMTGLASVCTDIGQCKEVMADGEAGKLVAVGDSTALADALIALLKNPDLRHTLGTRLRNHVQKHYGQEELVSKIEMIYRKVLSNGIT
jgi:glycosyltransferase involved in cell wall biosynthesis